MLAYRFRHKWLCTHGSLVWPVEHGLLWFKQLVTDSLRSTQVPSKKSFPTSINFEFRLTGRSSYWHPRYTLATHSIIRETVPDPSNKNSYSHGLLLKNPSLQTVTLKATSNKNNRITSAEKLKHVVLSQNKLSWFLLN